MAYSKGEWTARYAGHDLPWYIDTEDREVAKVLVYPTYPDNQARANARLIAAAPDLYEALLSALGSLVALDINNHSWGQGILDHIQKALAKAEGR